MSQPPNDVARPYLIELIDDIVVPIKVLGFTRLIFGILIPQNFQKMYLVNNLEW